MRYTLFYISFFASVAGFLSGCYATRHVEEGRYLLKGPVKVSTGRKLSPALLASAIEYKPNRKILVPKTYLHLYNMGKSMEKDSSKLKKLALSIPKLDRIYHGIEQSLINRIGDPPVLIDTEKLKEDSLNIFQACFANGFFYPKIQYKIDTIKNPWNYPKANIRFQVEEGNAYDIRSVTYVSTQEGVSPARWLTFIKDLDTTNSFLSAAKLPIRYSHNRLSQERLRMTGRLQNAGYYGFSAGMIEFFVDTIQYEPDSLHLQKNIQIEIDILKIPEKVRFGKTVVHIWASDDAFDDEALLTDTAKIAYQLKIPRSKTPPSVSPDSVCTNEVMICYSGKLRDKIDFPYIANQIYIFENLPYSKRLEQYTQQKLTELGMFQLVNVFDQYEEKKQVDYLIKIQTAQQFQLKTGLETYTNYDYTIASNLPILGASLVLRNKNTFGKSELSELSFGGSLGFYALKGIQDYFQNILYKIGIGYNLNVARFMVPFIPDKKLSILAYTPVTSLRLNLNTENRGEFNRVLAGLNYSYRWSHIEPNPKLQIVSQFTPLALDLIDLRIKNPDFQQTINNLPPALQRDYQSRLSTRTGYTFIHSTYSRDQFRPTFSFQAGIEIGGNIARWIDRYLVDDGTTQDHVINGNLFYGQYGKLSVENKLFFPLSERVSFVFRQYAGIARAYNTDSDSGFVPYRQVPFESRFFGGGANGMRGWRSNTLGPGRLSLQQIQQDFLTNRNNSLFGTGGEYILELNAELRFDVISYMEMAIFSDMGNVWFHEPIQGAESQTEPLSTLSPDNLTLGWDAGLGFRFDFSFLILRVDLAQQLHAPDRGWVFKSVFRDIGPGNTQLNLGIGYPF